MYCYSFSVHFLQVLSKDIKGSTMSSTVTLEHSSLDISPDVSPSKEVLSLQYYKVKLLLCPLPNAQADISFYAEVMENDLEITESKNISDRMVPQDVT